MSENKEVEDKINIKVVCVDGKESTFRIRKITKMAKLIENFGKGNYGNYRYNFDGKRIIPEDTPESLQLKDGDIIDAILEQTGG